MMRSVIAALLIAIGVPTAPLPAAPAVSPVAATPRVLPLQGGLNFRDLGGYATTDGHHVRWRLVFRSGEMSGLTAADYAYLDRLGIRSVCDLRTRAERDKRPTRWQGSPAPDYWTSDAFSNAEDPRHPILTGAHPTPESVRAGMEALYRRLPETYAAGYRAIFQRLAAGQVPLAFNCTAGKDRSGVAAALILAMLGVPRATIVRDYTLSDRTIDYAKLLRSPALATIARLPAPVQKAVLSADPRYIEAMLDALKTRYGGVIGYAHAVLGLSGADIAHIRARLLE